MKLTLVIAIVLLASCNVDPSYNQDHAMEKNTTESVMSIEIQPERPQTQLSDAYKNLKIIKTANARFKVRNLDSCTTQVQVLINKWNGYVADMRYTQNDYKLENRMVFKVPAANFDKMLADLTQLAEYVDYKNITS